MNTALIAGLLVFLTIHHFWIKPIWFILPPGLVIAALGGLAVGWSYAEIRIGLPPRLWTAFAVFALVGATLVLQFCSPNSARRHWMSARGLSLTAVVLG